MIESLYPFPVLGWLVVSGILWLCLDDLRVARYGIKVAWLFLGANGFPELQLSNFHPRLQQPLLLLHKWLGPRASPVSRLAALWIPAFALWVEVPLAHGGLWYANVWISGVAFGIMLSLLQLSGTRPERPVNGGR